MPSFYTVSEVTYSYNTCGMTGQRGPGVLLGQCTCSSHYDNTNSTITRDTCGMTGQRGPGVLLGQCSSHYDNTNSTIARDGVLFRVCGYRGTQGFRVRRSGRYNLTVAGAAGGRGLCSLYYGRGAVLKVTAYLTAGQDAAILVGQKGTGPCDVDPSHELCLKPPVNVNESENCSSLWNMTVVDSGGGGGEGEGLVWWCC